MINKKLLTSLMAAGLLLTTACSNENVWDYDGDKTVTEDEYVDVTFSITPESIGTRADNTPQNGKNTISKASKIDMLIYAVYEKHDNKFKCLTQYGRGVVPYETENQKADPNLVMPEELEEFIEPTNPHEGQTILYGFKNQDLTDRDKGLEIKLRLMRTKTYYLAFWAQSSKAVNVYNTNDLTAVKVNYEDALNNDETRDAFCKVQEFNMAEGTVINVVLYRPLAQINVGTTGADYYENQKNVEGYNKMATRSSIKVKGVYDTFNVLEDKIPDDVQALGNEVEFTMNTIPAYWNGLEIPSTDEELYQYNEDEQYLLVDLDYDGKFKNYLTEYSTIDENGKYKTETFKYLSMCYVLVPSSKQNPDNLWTEDEKENATDPDSGDDPDNNGSDKYKWFNSTVDVEVAFYDNDVDPGKSTLTVTQVPVQRNWRTNILGGLSKSDKPNDDKSSLFNVIKGAVTMNAEFMGDHSNLDHNGNNLDSNEKTE